MLRFNHLTDTGSNSELCFRCLYPKLETKMYSIEKFQVFTPIAKLLVKELKTKHRHLALHKVSMFILTF